MMMKLVTVCSVMAFALAMGCASETEIPPEPSPIAEEKAEKADKNDKNEQATPAVDTNQTKPEMRPLCFVDDCPPGFACYMGRCERAAQSPNF